MSEMEEKLNRLLDDPDAMSRILQMAQQISGTVTPPPSPAPDKSSEQFPDPQLMQRLLPLLKAWRESDSRTTQLLYALRPYLKEDKQSKIDRAVKLAHLISVGKKALTEWGLDLV